MSSRYNAADIEVLSGLEPVKRLRARISAERRTDCDPTA
jgi:hypothetical protein